MSKQAMGAAQGRRRFRARVAQLGLLTASIPVLALALPRRALFFGDRRGVSGERAKECGSGRPGRYHASGRGLREERLCRYLRDRCGSGSRSQVTQATLPAS